MSIVFVSFGFPVNVSELNLPKANVQEIEDAGAHLPEPELDEFRVWFES